MSKFKDLTGMKFGRLTVIERAIDRIDTKGKRHIMWKCLCSCGKTKDISRDSLLSNRVKSCGCLRAEKTKERKFKHGLRNTPLYRTWSNIKTRCYNPKNDTYKYYGEKGVTMCSEWKKDFLNFYMWSLENGYKEGLTIDRINSNGNYEPSNCRWVTATQQQNNKLNNYLIIYKESTHTLAEWSNILNINYKVLYRRIQYLNWSIERAFTTPVKNMNNKRRK